MRTCEQAPVLAKYVMVQQNRDCLVVTRHGDHTPQLTNVHCQMRWLQLFAEQTTSIIHQRALAKSSFLADTKALVLPVGLLVPR